MRFVAMLVVVLAAAGGVACASPALADVRTDILGCNNDDAPLPASPQGPASLNVHVTKAPKGADPFKDPKVSIESVYGTGPQWATYDNGCTGQFMAGAGTALGNILLGIAGLLPNWTHALLHSVLAPGSWLHQLTQPVVSALGATKAAVWGPWLSVVLVIVAAVVLLRARRGSLAGATSAAAWALLVLVATSWVLDYPTQSVHLVDGGLQWTTKTIATGFDSSAGKAAKDQSADAVMDRQMDQVVRTTQYRTWLTGAFGDPDSGTARTYGPRLFEATHFSWDEYATYAKDHGGKGKKIVEAKASSFKQIAGQVKSDDPRAYSYLTGNQWDQRMFTALVNLAMQVVVCAFLLAAGVSILLAFTLIRVLVPFAPVAGVLFMVDSTRDMAVGMLKRVVGPLVMGPVCLLLGLVLLRFDAALLATPVWFPVKLGAIGALAVIAWILVRPDAYSLRPLMSGLGLGAGLLGALRRQHREVYDEPAIRRLEAGPQAPPALPPGAATGGRPYMPGVDDRPALGLPAATPSIAPGPIALPGRPTDTPVRALSRPVSDRRSGPGISDPGLRKEFDELPKEEKEKWVPLHGYPSGGTALDKARFYADQLNSEDLELPQFQRNVIGGRWWNFAVADHYRATEVTIARYVTRKDPATGETVVTEEKDKNLFLDGLGFDDEPSSNKYCQVAELQPKTWFSYVNEFNSKYDTDRLDIVVADTPANRERVERGELRPDEINRPLDGEKIMRIPRQKQEIPEWARNYAEDQGVSIEETDPHPDAGEIQ